MKNVVFVNNIKPRSKFFSTEITEEFVQAIKTLMWTAVAVLATAITIVFLGLFFYIIKI